MYEGIVSECNVIYRMSRWGFRTNDQKIVKNKQHQAFRSFIRVHVRVHVRVQLM